MLQYIIDRSSRLIIYKPFIRPVLEYSDVVWEYCTEHDSHLLETVQVEATGIITGLRKGTLHHKLYNELGLEALVQCRENHK